MSDIPPRNFTEQFQNPQNFSTSTESENLYEVIIKYNGNVSKIAEDLDINIEILSKNYGIAKLVIIGMIIGSAAGMVLMYFYDHDRWMQCKAKKMMCGVKDAAQNMASGIKSTIGISDNKE